MGSSINATPKRYIHAWKVHWCDRCMWLWNKMRKEDKEPKQWQTRPPTFCMVGGLWIVVLHFKFDQNGLVVTEMWGVKIWVIALLWPMAYTTLYYPTGMIRAIESTTMVDNTQRSAVTQLQWNCMFESWLNLPLHVCVCVFVCVFRWESRHFLSQWKCVCKMAVD